MKYNGIYIKEDDMWSSYQKIGNKIKSKRFNPKETSIFIQFSKITCEIPELNSNVKNNGIDSYYSDLKLSLLDKHWNLESEWYFSFARRLIEKHNGISQFDECIKCLISDKFSRRCVLSTYVYNIDNEYYRPALLCITFRISNNRLFMNTHWRSEELFFAFPINCVAMLSFMKLVYSSLKNKYKLLELGTYSHFIDTCVIHSVVDINNFEWDFSKYVNLLDKNELKFLWSIVDKKKEEKYDESYRK